MSAKVLYEWWKARTLEGSAAMVEALKADALRARKATAERVVEDLLRENSRLEFRTTRFKFNAKVVHAEQWEDPGDGTVWVRFTMETCGPPQALDPEPDTGWKE